MGQRTKQQGMRVVARREIHESEGSRLARDAAGRLGEVVGSSYSSLSGEPVLWAFHVSREGTDPLILSGGAHSDRRAVLRVVEEHAYTGLLLGKALVGYAVSPLEPRSVVVVGKVPAEAGWYCDSFYLADDRLEGMDERCLLAVGLWAAEAGLSHDLAEAAVRGRSPELVSVPDPNAGQPGFRHWVKLVRSLRRARRLAELASPEPILEKEARISAEARDALASAPWLTDELWPADLRAEAARLGFLAS
jgi:hypothetical protein